MAADQLTPVEQHGPVWLKRDDLYQLAGVAGGKVRTAATLAGLAEPFTWKISAAWAAKPLDCTPAGITSPTGCGGACCYGPSFWPGRAGEGDACVHLGPEGCTFTEADRPVKCLLYPLVPNAKAKLVVHGRAATGCCKPNWGEGPPIVEALHSNLAALFGVAEADRIRTSVLAGQDTEVVVPGHVAAALAREAAWEAADVAPVARTGPPLGLITAGAAHSPQVNIIAHLGAALGIPVRVHVPARKELTPELVEARDLGAELITHRPGHNSVIVARAREDAEAHPGWTLIPFGMECQEAVKGTALQVANLPAELARIVVPVGSGMTLAGVLWGLSTSHKPGEVPPVVGVVVGADPEARLDKWAPPDWRNLVELIEHPAPYHKPADDTEWWGVELDAHYEAKAAEYVQPGDLLWVVGIRSSQPGSLQAANAGLADSKHPQTAPRPDGKVWAGPAELEELLVPVAELQLYRDNVREGDIGAISESLRAHGQYRPITANRGTHTGRPGEVATGNHTLQAAQALGWTHIAATWGDWTEDELARIVLVDNRLNDIAGYNQVGLAEVLAELAASPRGLEGTGFDSGALDDLLRDLRREAYKPTWTGTLRERFIAPPFTVLDGRQGYWRTRKQQWLDLGIRGEEGRAHLSSTSSSWYLERGEAGGSGGSVFDPVLTELAYRWFCTPGGHILDPFAGGTTRGAVAGVLGYDYTGVDLRPEQVEANIAQLQAIPDVRGQVRWLEGDSAELPTGPVRGGWRRAVWEAAPYDLLFTCPPYFDLEPYSTEQADGSAKPTWPEFVTWYKELFAKAVGMLADNSFAAIVVGEIRDKQTGAYRNLLGLTIDAFTEAGLSYFNEATYLTPVGSLPVRTAAHFPPTRKLGKGHQNLLVFYKGEPNRIREDWPELATTEYAQPEQDPDT